MAKKSKLSAGAPREAEAVQPFMIGFTDDFLRTGAQALEQIQAYLGIQIDTSRLADPEWLRDPENRKIAMVLIKLASIQTNLALGIISGSLKAAGRLPDMEAERRREALREDLSRRLMAKDNG